MALILMVPFIYIFLLIGAIIDWREIKLFGGKDLMMHLCKAMLSFIAASFFVWYGAFYFIYDLICYSGFNVLTISISLVILLFFGIYVLLAIYVVNKVRIANNESPLFKRKKYIYEENEDESECEDETISEDEFEQ